MVPHAGIVGRIIIFVAIVAGLSAIVSTPIIAAGSTHIGGIITLLAVWVPAIAAFLACRIYHEPVRSLGWHLRKPRYLALAYLLPVAYTAIIGGIVWLIGAGTFTGNGPAHLPFYIGFATLGTMIATLGEELGWRGYLVPHLASAYSFTTTALVSGLIWAVWHYPILLFTDYGTGGPRWYLLLCFTVSIVGLSFAAAWLRLQTGSVWSAVLLHTSHNLFMLGIFAPLMVEGCTMYLLTGEGGLLMVITGVILAVVFWSLRARLTDAELPAPGSDEVEVGTVPRSDPPRTATLVHRLRTR